MAKRTDSVRVLVRIEFDHGGGLRGETSLAWRRIPGHAALVQLSRMIERALVACGAKRVYKPDAAGPWRDMPARFQAPPRCTDRYEELQLELGERIAKVVHRGS